MRDGQLKKLGLAAIMPFVQTKRWSETYPLMGFDRQNLSAVATEPTAQQYFVVPSLRPAARKVGIEWKINAMKKRMLCLRFEAFKGAFRGQGREIYELHMDLPEKLLL